jgi:ATPase subunit of ABC transporter with duplicated ATPase domains
MAEYVYTLRNVRKAHGDKVVLDNVTLSFLHGAKIGVVGPNGTGKSSLLKIMAGLDQPNNGDAIIDPDATVGMLQQEPPLTEGKTVLENVEEAVGEIKGKLDRYNEISEQMADPDADFDTLLAEMGDLQTDLDHASAWDLDSRLDQAMDALRCPPPDVLVDNLSGGERRRVALCKLLLQQPDLLLLDEPTNHLDAESVQWLEGHLASYPGAVLAITHDRYFLDNVAEWILELDRGQTHPPPQDRGAEGRQARQDAREGAGVGPLQRQGPPDQEQVAPGPLRGDGGGGRQGAQDRHRRHQHPARPAPR